MNHEELQIAKTESLFREVNERIAETAEQFGSATGSSPKLRAIGAAARRLDPRSESA